MGLERRSWSLFRVLVKQEVFSAHKTPHTNATQPETTEFPKNVHGMEVKVGFTAGMDPCASLSSNPRAQACCPHHCPPCCSIPVLKLPLVVAFHPFPPPSDLFPSKLVVIWRPPLAVTNCSFFVCASSGLVRTDATRVWKADRRLLVFPGVCNDVIWDPRVDLSHYSGCGQFGKFFLTAKPHTDQPHMD